MRNNEERFGVNKQIQDAAPMPQEQSGLNLNFVIPTEFVELPSKGKFYSQNHPLYGQSSIEIKQMTAKEEDILTSKSLLKKGVALDKLIASLVVDKSIDPDSLTVEDRNAIVVSARISGYGSEYVTNVICPSCENKDKFTFDLSEKVAKLEEQMEEAEVDENGHFEMVLPATKWKVVCRALNGKDEKTMLRVKELKKNSSNDSMLLDQLKLIIVSIQSVTDLSVLETALSSMPASDSRYLRRRYSEVVKSYDMTQRYSCNKCDYQADMEVPLSADFFWFK